MLHVKGVFKVFLGRAPNCVIFYKRMFFRQSKFEANRGKNGSRGFGGMLYRKNFEFLHGVTAFLVLFKEILIKLFAPHSETSPNMLHFVCTFLLYACLLQTRSGFRKFWWEHAILS